MLILHVIATLDLQAGGPATNVRSIVGSYAGLGHQGEVLTLDDPSASYLKGLNFRVHALGPVSTTFGYTRRLIPWLLAERHRFDGVVIHGLWQYLGYAVRKAFRHRAPYFVFTHGMLDPYFKKAKLKHLKKWAYWILAEYWVLRDAARVLFTSEPEAELAKRSFWLHHWVPKVVPYGATMPAGPSDIFRQKFLAQYPALQQTEDEPKRFLLFLGRIHPKKGCDLLLRAFIKIEQIVPDMQLVFAGPDQVGWQSELAAMAADHGIQTRVHWTGMLNGEMKWGALHACEAFVLPSHQENFGIAVAEALACSKPVLISNKVNIWEQVVQDGAALVEEDSQAGTFNLLDRWIKLNPNKRAKMGSDAYLCFLRRYDMKENARSIADLFTEIRDIALDGKHSY